MIVLFLYSYEGDHRVGTPLYEEKLRVKIVQPGQEEALVRLSSTIPVPRGDLYKEKKGTEFFARSVVTGQEVTV